MLTFEDVKITENVATKPFDHTPDDELHVKVFESDPLREMIYNPLMRIGQGRAEVNVNGVMRDLVELSLVLSYAKVVSFTANTITVRSPSGTDAVFVDGGMVKVDSGVLVDHYDGEMRYRTLNHVSAWIAVTNYRANEDGTQTWDYRIEHGELVEGAEMFAYYYGQSGNSYYEVTGPSGWRL